MKRRLVKTLWSCTVTVMALTLLVGCETEMDARLESDLSLQARGAMEVLPADAGIVGMVNLQEIKRNTTLNPLNRMGHEPGIFPAEGRARLEDFIEATGFDPEKDLDEVYIALTGRGSDRYPTLAAYAGFDRDRLQQYVDENMRADFEAIDYEGVTLYRSTKSGDQMVFALVNDNMIVASPEEEQVHAMIDRLSGSGSSLKDNQEVMSLIRQAGKSSAWFVGHDLPSIEGEGDAPSEMQQLGKAVRDVVVAVEAESDGIEGDTWLTPVDGVSAGDLADLTRGLVAAMKASVPDSLDGHRDALDDVRVQESDGRVRVRFAFDNDLIAHEKIH